MSKERNVSLLTIHGAAFGVLSTLAGVALVAFELLSPS